MVAAQLMRHRSLEAAALLAEEGIECEVIDPRTIAPLDTDTIVASLGRTGRLVCVQESPPAGSWGQAVIAACVDDRFRAARRSAALIAADAMPVPYAQPLEDAALPGVERIAAELRALARA